MNKVKSLASRITRSDYLQSIFTLMTGTIFSQLIPILASPLLTRIYEPKDFGVLAVYMSVVITVAVIATGRYEQAVILPKEDDDAIQIVFLTIILSFVFSILLWGGVEASKLFYSSYFEKLEIINWISLVPFSVLTSAIYQTLYGWLSRKKEFRTLTMGRVIASITMTVSQLLLFHISLNGLLLGYIIGQTASMFFLMWKFLSTFNYQNSSHLIRIEGLQKQAQRYVKFPTFLIIGHTLNSLSGNMPVFLLSNLFGANISGFYSLTFRVVATPMSLIGISTAEVFRQKASMDFANNGKCDGIFLKTFKLLLSISILPAIIFFFAAPYLFPLLFGQQWLVAGQYAQLLTPMFLVQFVTVPLCQMFIVAEKQELDLAWQIVRMFLSILAIYIGYHYYHSDVITVALFSLAFAGLYAVSGIMAYRFSLGKQIGVNS